MVSKSSLDIISLCVWTTHARTHARTHTRTHTHQRGSSVWYAANKYALTQEDTHFWNKDAFFPAWIATPQKDLEIGISSGETAEP